MTNLQPNDFKLSVVDRAIKIVQHSECNHAYSCFAIERAAQQAWEGSYYEGLGVAYDHSRIYADFAEMYFSDQTLDVVRRFGDNMPFWWSSDDPRNRYIPERVAFLRVFREWLVEQGAGA